MINGSALKDKRFIILVAPESKVLEQLHSNHMVIEKIGLLVWH